MLDLPLLTGNESPEAPVIAVAASPWPGSVAVYGSDTGDDWGFEANVPRAANIGETLTPLSAARVGQYDRGPALELKVSGGGLGSISEAALLNGGNVAAIGDPSTGVWEVFQFRDAVLVDADTWALSMRLRGQRGTDGLVPDVWPVGSVVVILDGNIVPVSLSQNRRGVARSYRVGPASKPVDHPAYRRFEHTAMGVGLRPYQPVHLGWRRDDLGDVAVSWTRQTRIDGDFWNLGETPLGEVREAYQVRVRVGGVVRREVTVLEPSWNYGAADQLSDGVSGAFVIEVAQISDRFGPGLYGEVSVDD